MSDEVGDHVAVNLAVDLLVDAVDLLAAPTGQRSIRTIHREFMGSAA